MQNLGYHPAVSLLPELTGDGSADAPRVAVVIPCYRVRRHILSVIEGIGDAADAIYVVDDACPEQSGDFVAQHCGDPRVQVVRLKENRGVGGAVMAGMHRALADGAAVVVKMDGDGQMDPSYLPLMVDLIARGEADYVKGNRFFDPDGLSAMPKVRLFGNAGLSFLAKLSTGYWQTFDPTNGYFAMHAEIARRLPMDKIDNRYFFESDLLFRLNTLQARVVDLPMPAIYADEESNLKIGRILLPFAAGHMRNFFKRIGYNYFLRNFSIASLELVAGLVLLAFGTAYGIAKWSGVGATASAGTVMLAGLPVILGIQFLLAFVSHDIQSSPQSALHPRLVGRGRNYWRHAGATTRKETDARRTGH